MPTGVELCIEVGRVDAPSVVPVLQWLSMGSTVVADVAGNVVVTSTEGVIDSEEVDGLSGPDAGPNARYETRVVEGMGP